MSSWFSRSGKGIKTPTSEKMDTPRGLWRRTPKGKIIHINDLKANAYVCPEDDYHFRIGSKEYFEILLDDNKFTELNKDLESLDPLSFVDKKPYTVRLSQAKDKTKLKDAIRSVIGKLHGISIVIACMDFSFIGGSMGSVVGEKIKRAIDYAIQQKTPLLIISKSGGARMQEASFSLFQMPKITSRLYLLEEAKIPYISLLTDPTTGGVSASFAMLGDFNIAEPNALIGFAGPKIIQETIKRPLPEGFQRSEFLLEHGFVDFIVHRTKLKNQLYELLSLLQC